MHLMCRKIGNYGLRKVSAEDISDKYISALIYLIENWFYAMYKNLFPILQMAHYVTIIKTN
jgi:hypothetical protein